jgi:hypothetical protein
MLSSVLIGYASLWFAAAFAFYLANRQSKDGWSAAPVPVMWALVILPLLALVLAVSLVSARRAQGQRLRVFDYFAIAAAVAPFAFVGVVFLVMALTR